MKKTIVALGNPGAKYELTKHNIAWLVVDRLLDGYQHVWKEKFKGFYCKISVAGSEVFILKPHTYMNLSGESAQALNQFFKITPDETIAIHDELDFPYGQIAFKKGGGFAGHNGLKSLAQHFSTDAFYRLRLGIGRPVHGSVSDWVLSPFRGEEDQLLEEYIDFCAKALESYLKNGYKKALNEYNKKTFNH